MAENLNLNLRLRVNSDGTVSAINANTQAIRQLSSAANSANQSMRQAEAASHAMGGALNSVAAIAASALGGLSIAKVVDELGSFESKMINVKALTMADAAAMAQMTKQARELGATTAFSAQQAAEAQGVLASAGLKANEILSATPQVLQLAAAGALDLKQATEIAMGTVSGLGLKLSDLGHINDVLAKTAGDSQSSVADLGAAITQVAPLAKLSNISLEELAASLGILANNNIKGATAGDQLKSMLNALSRESKPLTDTLANYGLTMKDVDISSRGYLPVLESLRKAHLSAADTFQIFGTESAAVGTILSQNRPEVEALTKALKDAEGAADVMAAILNTGLEKELDALLGTVSEAILQLGDAGLTGSMSNLVTSITGVISVYEGLLTKYAEANKLTADQANNLRSLAVLWADSTKTAIGFAGGIFAVVGAMKAYELATIAVARVSAINPFVGLMVSLGALIGLIVTAKSELMSLTDAQSRLADIDAKIAHQKQKISIMQNEGFVGRAIDIVTGNSVGEASDQITLLQHQREQITKGLDAEKKANEAAAKAAADKAIADAQASAKASALNEVLKGSPPAHKAAEGASKSHKTAIDRVAQAIDRELKSLDDQHAKLTLSERDYYAQTDVVQTMTAAQKALALAKWDQVKVDEAAKKASDAQKSELESLTQKYNDLTLSARDAYIEQLKAKGITPENITTDVGKYDQIVKLEADRKKIDDNVQALKNYASSLDTANNSLQGFGSQGSMVFDGLLGGISATAGAFSNLLTGINQNKQALTELQTQQALLANTKLPNASAEPEKYAEAVKLKADLSAKFNQKQIELSQQATQLQLAGYGQIAGAAKGLFSEQSAGYKAMQAAEQTFRAFEIASALQAFLTKQGFLLSWLGIDTATKATATATETAFTATSVAESGVRATAYGTAAYANTLASVPFPFNLAAGAAVLAALVAAGVSIFGGDSGYANIAEDRQKNQGTGTVLGDAKAQSDSISKAIGQIKDANLASLPLTAQIAKSLRNIEGGINGLSVFTSQRIVGDGSGLFNLSNSSRTNNLGQLLTGQSIAGQVVGGIGAAISGIGLIEGVGNLILGTITASLSSLILPGIGLVLSLIPGFSEFIASGFETQYKVRDQGINLPNQSLGQLRQQGLSARAYADIEEIDHVFWIETSRTLRRKYQALSQTALDSITDILTGLVDTVASGGQLLGIETTQLQQRLDAFVLSIGDISLYKIKGEDLTKALNAAFSKAGDQLAGFVVPGLDEFQQQNEGLLQTLVRVATGVEQARVGLQSLNVQTINYTNISNKQGDVFAEVVRQSIVAVEQLNGAANGVGQIIDALSGSGTDLLGTYQQLLAVRQLMTATGLNGGALDATLIGGAGGLDVLKTGLETFQDKFFSEEQKFNAATVAMSQAFAALNLALPDSRAGFVDLVQGIDDSTAAGRTLLGQVFRLAEGFDNLATQAENLLNKLNDNITNAYDTAADLLNKQITQYGGFAESLKKYSDSLISNAATNSPSTQYSLTRDKFFDLKKVLATGTEAEKLTALGQLQDVAGAFDEASRAFNKSGMGYVKDRANIQGVLASAIGYSTTKADVAQSQLDTLKDQLEALGLLQAAMTDVKTAVEAVGIAIAGLEDFKQAQQQSQALSANQAAFNQIEQSRKTAYDATIVAMSRSEDRATTGARIQQAAAVRGYVNSSKSDFSVAAAFNPATGTNTSAYDGYTGGGKAGQVWSELTGSGGQFERIRNLVANTARTLTGIIGGALPDVHLTVAKAGTTYAFGGKQAFYAGDTVDSMLLGFARDAAGYLAEQTGKADWIGQIKDVPFNSLATGFAELADVVTRMKHPYQAGVFDPTIDYTQQIDGSHKDGLSRVPFDGYIAELHQGERVLTRAEADRLSTSIRIERNDDQLIAELRTLKKELETLNKKIDEQNRHAAANVATDQAGFKQMISALQNQVAAIENEARRRRITEAVNG